MHLTTKALVLREVNYKEADKILTALTADEGKMTVSARGVRRKSGATAAACQQLCWGEFTQLFCRGDRDAGRGGPAGTGAAVPHP